MELFGVPHTAVYMVDIFEDLKMSVQRSNQHFDTQQLVGEGSCRRYAQFQGDTLDSRD